MLLNKLECKEKRIGILTHPLIANYGGILQNYALQQVFKKFGYVPVTFRLREIPTLKKNPWIIDFFYFFINRFVLRRKSNFPILPLFFKYKKKGMEEFIKRNIIVTPEVRWYSPSLLSDFKLEALCVGSDKIWASYFTQIEDLFFSFAKDYKIPKFSYAPSFGSSVWNFSDEKTKELIDLVKDFTGLSVREKSGIQLCRQYLKRDAQWVLDPTLLLSSDDYNLCCEHIPKKQNKFVFAYILNMTLEKELFINNLAHKLGYEVCVLRAEKYIKRSDTIEKWLAFYRDASYIITDSFHGTIFSIIYNKEFVSIINSQRGADRFTSLKDLFSLEGRIVEKVPLIDEVISSSIDWNQINNQLMYRKEISLNYIKRSLLMK